MKVLLKLLSLFLLVICASCGKLEDKQVIINYAGAVKPVKLGDYYWIHSTENPETVIAADSQMNPVGIINKIENPSDFQTVVNFINNSTRHSAQK